jgi:hypothetical protein
MDSASATTQTTVKAVAVVMVTVPTTEMAPVRVVGVVQAVMDIVTGAVPVNLNYPFDQAYQLAYDCLGQIALIEIKGTVLVRLPMNTARDISPEVSGYNDGYGHSYSNGDGHGEGCYGYDCGEGSGDGQGHSYGSPHEDGSGEA